MYVYMSRHFERTYAHYDMYVNVCMHACMHVYMYIYTYIHAQEARMEEQEAVILDQSEAHIHTYIHTYMNTCTRSTHGGAGGCDT